MKLPFSFKRPNIQLPTIKLPFPIQWLPLITLGAGGLSMVLRFWYLSCRDSKNLLPAHHFGNTVSFIFFALAVILIAVVCLQLPKENKYSKLFPASILRAVGCAVGALTIVFTSIYDVIHQAELSVPALILGILAAISLLLLAFCRFTGSRPTAFLFLFPVIYLMFHAVIQARLWSSETQPSVIFYPFMASIFLLLQAYFLAALTVRQKGIRAYVFFNQLTLLLCCISCSGNSALFYLGMAAWVGLDLGVFHKAPKEES